MRKPRDLLSGVASPKNCGGQKGGGSFSGPWPSDSRKTWEAPFLAFLIYFKMLEKQLSQASFL